MDKDWLIQQYSVLRRSPGSIGNEVGLGQMVVRRYLKQFGIPFRSLKESYLLRSGNYVSLSSDAFEFLDGELLGDIHLAAISDYSGQFSYSSKHESYLKWLSLSLSSFGILQSGSINQLINKKQNNCITYQYKSITYRDLAPMRARWYPLGKKIVPPDLVLTPLVCRQWYLGDGSFSKRERSVRLYCDDFTIAETEFLKDKLQLLGFSCSRQNSRNVVRFDRKNSSEFLSYIGPCPVDCYSYKWG